jgi:hypothetical protein
MFGFGVDQSCFTAYDVIDLILVNNFETHDENVVTNVFLSLES